MIVGCNKEMLNYTCIKIISAPASARAMAAACPMPLVPPVTKAVCPSKENIFAVSIFAIFQIVSCKLTGKSREEKRGECFYVYMFCRKTAYA